MNGSKTYKYICIGLTFFLAFLTVNNVGSYSSSENVPTMRESIISGLEEQAELYESDPKMTEAFEAYILSIEESLTERRFRQHSLFRIIGCLLSLVGVVFLRLHKTIGLHLFVAGMIFSIFTGFYTLGIGIMGWVLNILYAVLLLTFGLYFFSKRKELA
ncbi:MAG: hypothetical protein COA58_16645 [Bacteroidetes bacterium]|nr:MAG: hypothetical protein COA58_16645 [Bacteroidota bacterium]